MPSKSKFFLIITALMLSVGVFFVFKYVSAQLACTCAGGNGCDESCVGPADPDCGICTDNLTEFTTGATVDIDLPAGGCSSEAKIVLPMSSKTWGSKICATSVDIDYTGSASALTPYIWVPLSGQSRVVQIDTATGDFVAMYGVEDGVITCAAGTNCIWDCTANCGTNNPVWTERMQDPDCAFSDPSRITVIAGSQVWVANRSSPLATQSVTQLEVVGATGNYECKGTYPVGPGPRGVTFDSSGNIWVGDYGDNFIYKFNSGGGLIFSKGIVDSSAAGVVAYGMIADSNGYIWISTGAGRDVVAIDTNNCAPAACPTAYEELNFSTGGMIYGIGIDNEGDLWAGDWNGDRIHEIDGLDADAGPIGDVVTTCSNSNYDLNSDGDCTDGGEPGFCLTGCCTGIAVDRNNNVWFNGYASENTYMIEGEDCAKLHSFPNVCDSGAINRSNPHGVAIDANNDAWVVCTTGVVRKLSFDGVNIVSLKYIDLNASANSGTGGSASYNYSDMTGLRTPSLSVTIGGQSFPLPPTGTLTNFGCGLESTLQTCDCPECKIMGCEKPEWWGLDCCELPFEVCTVFSGGQYTLSNLNIEYKATPPSFLGGLVPCGRHVDDPTTNIDEAKTCTLCHIFVLVKRVVDLSLLYLLLPLMAIGLIAAGVAFIGAAGSKDQISTAKGILMFTFKGVLLALAAWLIIQTIVMVLVPNSRPWKSWMEIVCPVEPCNSNGACQTNIGEDAQNCPTDCYCDFNDICDMVTENIVGNPQACPDCAVCGNNIKDIDEECDGADYGPILNQKIIDAGGRDCNIVGTYKSGTFNCTSECRIDKTGCAR